MVLERFIGHNEAAATDLAMAKDSPQRSSSASVSAAQQAAAKVRHIAHANSHRTAN